MPIQAYIAFGIFIVLGLHAFFTKWLELRLESLEKAIFYKDRLIAHMEKLDRWQHVRPYIYRGYCSYARKLILEMIEAYEYLLEHKHEKDRDALHALHRLLFELPPDHDPPATGGSLFVIASIYARIGALQRWSGWRVYLDTTSHSSELFEQVGKRSLLEKHG